MSIITVSIVLALVMETVTLIGRLVLRQKASAWTWNRPFGIRIHHGYWAPLLWISWYFISDERIGSAALVLGNALLLSDIVHHALLKIFTGNAEL